MEPQTQSQKIKTASIIVVVILIIGGGYAFFAKDRTSPSGQPANGAAESTPMKVVVKETPAVEGIVPAPAGFPSDIPLENISMTESATTDYPEYNARQLSLSYFSSKTVTQKYAEYKNYLQQAGYEITEGDAKAPVRAVFGTRADANLSVAVSRQGEQTFVQVAYLLKSL